MKKMVAISARLIVSIISVCCMASCEGSHSTLGPEDGGPSTDGTDASNNDIDAGGAEDGGVVPNETCESQGGVSVQAEIRFDGEVPAAARLWAYFEAPEGGIPPCSLEIVDVAFPASFRFDDVPSDKSWSLTAFLDVDGGFPPIPVAGDYRGRIEAKDLDLSGDLSGLVIVLEPYDG